MENKPVGSQLTQTKSNLPVPENINEYFNQDILDRRWEVTINWKTKIYLTDDERDYFLKLLSSGAKIIQVGKVTLTDKFDCIIPIRNKKENKEFKLVGNTMVEE